MKKLLLILIIITSSCVSTKTHNTYTKLDTKIEYYTSNDTRNADFPFSDATIVNNVIYVAGQVGNIPGNNNVVEGGIREETKQTMRNIILEMRPNLNPLKISSKFSNKSLIFLLI